ncbi:golgin subfamily A member 6C [Labeo rohita]|uniref:Golgin subfamily A member 6C n=1 Tax=Labeo rohita TaxID=84645 RepID=A0A498NPU7_LABRO|nr:golgin subfamily A member 6C [Labeo rohita]
MNPRPVTNNYKDDEVRPVKQDIIDAIIKMNKNCGEWSWTNTCEHVATSIRYGEAHATCQQRTTKYSSVSQSETDNDTLDVEIENILFKIYQYFHIYTVRTESLKEYYYLVYCFAITAVCVLLIIAGVTECRISISDLFFVSLNCYIISNNSAYNT